MKIAIVGAGIAGLVSGWLAAEAGHGVTIFEKDRLGAGASGRALGVLVPITGLDRPIDKLQREGIATWPDLAMRLSTKSGVAVDDFWKDWGDGQQQVRLPLIFEVLRAGIVAMGGKVEEGVAVDSPALLRERCDRVVLAGGLGNVVLAEASMKVSAGVAGRFTGTLDKLVVGDNLFICPDWDGTMIAGSVNWEIREAGDVVVPAEKLEELVRRVGALVPGLELVDAWVGYRPVEVPRLPLVRDLGDGILAVVGLGKVGIGLAPMLRVWE